MSETRVDNRTRFYVERKGARYKICVRGDCTRRCSFARRRPDGTCEGGCNLPMWFRKSEIGRWIPLAFLVKIEEKKGARDGK